MPREIHVLGGVIDAPQLQQHPARLWLEFRAETVPDRHAGRVLRHQPAQPAGSPQP